MHESHGYLSHAIPRQNTATFFMNILSFPSCLIPLAGAALAEEELFLVIEPQGYAAIIKEVLFTSTEKP